jgi:hypothetical protein
MSVVFQYQPKQELANLCRASRDDRAPHGLNNLDADQYLEQTFKSPW